MRQFAYVQKRHARRPIELKTCPLCLHGKPYPKSFRKGFHRCDRCVNRATAEAMAYVYSAKDGGK